MGILTWIQNKLFYREVYKRIPSWEELMLMYRKGTDVDSDLIIRPNQPIEDKGYGILYHGILIKYMEEPDELRRDYNTYIYFSLNLHNAKKMLDYKTWDWMKLEEIPNDKEVRANILDNMECFFIDYHKLLADIQTSLREEEESRRADLRKIWR